MKYIICGLLFFMSLSSQAQLKLDFSSSMFLGSWNRYYGGELLSYKDGFVKIALQESKTDKSKRVLATQAKDKDGNHITGFFYNQYTFNKDDDKIFDYQPQDFIRLKGGHYMVCGKGYVVELDENLKHSSNFIKRKDFYYYSLSEGVSGQVLVAYSDSKGNLGTLVFHSEGTQVNYKTSTYNPSGSNQSYSESLVLNDSMYIESYGYYKNDKRVHAFALKSYASIVENANKNNFRWEFVFEDYRAVSNLIINDQGYVVGVGKYNDVSSNKFELFVFDPVNKKIILKKSLNQELSNSNIAIPPKITVVNHNSQYLLLMSTGFQNSSEVDKTKWQWMAERKYLPYTMVCDEKGNVLKKGFLVSPDQKLLFKNTDISGAYFSFDPSNNRLFFKSSSAYYRESYMMFADPVF